MNESFAVIVLRLFREFNCTRAVANLLGVKYHKVNQILVQEQRNQRAVKSLIDKEVWEWPNRYAESQTRCAKWNRNKKAMVKMAQQEQQKVASITFGYGGNDFLKGDTVERDTHKHDDQVKVRKGPKAPTTMEPARWGQTL